MSTKMQVIGNSYARDRFCFLIVNLKLVDAKKSIRIPAEEAYGEYHPHYSDFRPSFRSLPRITLRMESTDFPEWVIVFR